MSLQLNGGTIPKGLEAKVREYRTTTVVFIGDYSLSLTDFLALTDYVLTNTNLVKDDPRLTFVERIGRLKQVKGFPTFIAGKDVTGDAKRLAIPE